MYIIFLYGSAGVAEKPSQNDIFNPSSRNTETNSNKAIFSFVRRKKNNVCKLLTRTSAPERIRRRTILSYTIRPSSFILFFLFFFAFLCVRRTNDSGIGTVFFLFFFLLAFLSIVLHRMTKCVSTLINWKEEKKTKTKKRNTKYARRTPARQTPFGRWP